jgi:Zn-dependent M28 family amino/carboxypeptidase
MKLKPEMIKPVKSYNVIGEIKGTEKPNEIIVVGAHLDSWDLAQGAHDDGTGVVQCIEVLRMFKDLKFKPKRTIRVVLFMNEEFGLKGGLKYADSASRSQDKHIAAIETDAGGSTPIGFDVDSTMEMVSHIAKWKDVLGKYGVYTIEQGHGGADIGPLKKSGAVPIGLRVDSQRYFDYHHAATDTFDKVNKRELELGGAAIASMAYLLAEFGVE